jgi:hypothetical protein
MKKLFLCLLGLLFHVSLYSAVVETEGSYSEKECKNEHVTVKPNSKKKKSFIRSEIFLDFQVSKWGRKLLKLKEKLIKLRKSIRNKAIFKNKIVGKVGNILSLIFFGIPGFIGIVIGTVMMYLSLGGNLDRALLGSLIAVVAGVWALLGALILDDDWLSIYAFIVFLIPSIAFLILLILQIIVTLRGNYDVAYLILLTILLAGGFAGFYSKVLP